MLTIKLLFKNEKTLQYNFFYNTNKYIERIFRMKKHIKKTAPVKVKSENLQRKNRNVAGIDIGAHSVYVCAGTSNEALTVFEVPTFTEDLRGLIKQLKEFNVESVAMEATGIYWIVVYDMIEDAGMEAYLVNPRDVKAIPGKKTDVQDCRRIQQLHSYGMLKRSFRPDKEVVTLRSYMRHRSTLVDLAAMQLNLMHKALVQMNVQIGQVVSDISGITGMRIIEAIVSGERNPIVLAKLRDPRCKSSEAEISKSLEGNFKSKHLLALEQNLHIYNFANENIVDCDCAIEEWVTKLQASTPSIKSAETTANKDKKTQPKKKKKASNKSAYNFDATELLINYAGVDLTTLPGISDNTAMKVFSEIGTDMSRWETEGHFTSWLGLCPGNKISGGKILNGATKKCNNRVAMALRMSASTLYRSNTAIGAFFRRLSARIGIYKAITATARKLAVYIYNMIKDKKNYQDAGGDAYEKQYQQRVVKGMTRKAAALGYVLVKADDLSQQTTVA